MVSVIDVWRDVIIQIENKKQNSLQKFQVNLVLGL